MDTMYRGAGRCSGPRSPSEGTNDPFIRTRGWETLNVMATAASPAAATAADLPDVATLRRAVASAVRAPSVYNSQPWRWRVAGSAGVDLYADQDRHLITIDSNGRDLLLSCAPPCTTWSSRWPASAGPHTSTASPTRRTSTTSPT